MSYKDLYIMYFVLLKRLFVFICFYYMFGDVNCVINYIYIDNLFFIFDIYEYLYINLYCFVIYFLFFFIL